MRISMVTWSHKPATSPSAGAAATAKGIPTARTDLRSWRAPSARHQVARDQKRRDRHQQGQAKTSASGDPGERLSMSRHWRRRARYICRLTHRPARKRRAVLRRSFGSNLQTARICAPCRSMWTPVVSQICGDDVHVADLVALPRIDRAAMGRRRFHRSLPAFAG
jgi:hypothetical protein